MAKEPDFFCRQVTAARRFHLDIRSGSAAGLSVVSGGWEHCAADYRISRPGFPWLGIELVTAGAGRLAIAGADYPIAAGSLFTYGPEVAHEIVSDPRRPLRKYFLDLGGAEAPALLRTAGLAPGTAVQLPRPAQVRAILDLLIEAGGAGGAQAPAVCAALATAAVHAAGGEAVPPGRAQEAAFASYLRCRNWLEEQDGRLTSLAAAARACGVSAAYLCRLFRRYDRETPWALVRRRRLQQAAALLADPSLSVAAVADRLGFSDPFHFSRAFRQAFGVPPQRFRQLGR
jgi:AraC family transcriptional regulator of arabinose operon